MGSGVRRNLLRGVRETVGPPGFGKRGGTTGSQGAKPPAAEG